MLLRSIWFEKESVSKRVRDTVCDIESKPRYKDFADEEVAHLAVSQIVEDDMKGQFDMENEFLKDPKSYAGKPRSRRRDNVR